MTTGNEQTQEGFELIQKRVGFCGFLLVFCVAKGFNPPLQRNSSSSLSIPFESNSATEFSITQNEIGYISLYTLCCKYRYYDLIFQAGKLTAARVLVPVPVPVVAQPPASGLGSMYWHWCAVVLLLCVP